MKTLLGQIHSFKKILHRFVTDMTCLFLYSHTSQVITFHTIAHPLFLSGLYTKTVLTKTTVQHIYGPGIVLSPVYVCSRCPQAFTVSILPFSGGRGGFLIWQSRSESTSSSFFSCFDRFLLSESLKQLVWSNQSEGKTTHPLFFFFVFTSWGTVKSKNYNPKKTPFDVGEKAFLLGQTEVWWVKRRPEFQMILRLNEKMMYSEGVCDY